MNEIIQKGIDQASLDLIYWGAEKEKLENFNANIAISTEHELSLENCEKAIAAAQAQLDTQITIAKDLIAKNQLIKPDYEKYLAFLKKTIQTLKDVYEAYPNPVLKVTIATLQRIVAVVEAIINLFN
ncbi:MAG TPA: hypothetical protein PK605_00420 [Ignavibacteria bacterium]|nr:hypothetical protein [Bacteroidota bacterium]HRE10756.1 hypothetical protein [Ignavibacteria bacterium]HRF66002.1 hypothetical protein [Ignavibacteria bacterium]HRJ02843.1 hypothetical protein [Ignavibacteria bacterium]HRJ84401.1 hypothetical protein [Ignavibacteria bacterium]